MEKREMNEGLQVIAMRARKERRFLNGKAFRFAMRATYVAAMIGVGVVIGMNI